MTYRAASRLALREGRPDVALVWATLALHWPGDPECVTDEDYRHIIAARPAVLPVRPDGAEGSGP